jgi:uncharacterized coiled-coil DUF342 family protein
MTEQRTRSQEITAQIAHLSDLRRELVSEVEDIEATVALLLQERSELLTELPTGDY